MVIREPGIGGSCPNCNELFGSEARFCWACGMPVAPGAQRPAEAIRPALGHIESTVIELPPPPPSHPLHRHRPHDRPAAPSPAASAAGRRRGGAARTATRRSASIRTGA